MSLNFSFNLGPQSRPNDARPEPGRPFRILVLADFSSRSNRDGPADPASRPRKIADLDTIDELPAAFDTLVRTACGVEITPTELDHFHPDELYRRLPVFAALRDLRKRLQEPSTFEAAAKEVAAMTGAAAPDAAGAPGDETKADDFTALLAGGFGQTATPASPAVDALVRSAMAPHIVKTDPRKDELIAAVDEAIGGQMRTILHDGHWSHTESCWLGLRRLVTQLELDEELTCHAADVTLADLAADAENGARGIDALLDGPARGEEPIAVAVVCARFDASLASVKTLAALAAVAQRTGCRVVGGAHDRLLGVESIAATPDHRDWSTQPIGDGAAAFAELRARTEASGLCLVGPRHLARLPYGAKTDEIDAFPFEEVADDEDHEHHTWTPSSVLVAEAFGRAFSAEGWGAFQSGGAGGSARIDDIPVRALSDGTMLPCAEAWIPEAGVEAVLARGITPVVSVRGAGEAVLGPIVAINREALKTGW